MEKRYFITSSNSEPVEIDDSTEFYSFEQYIVKPDGKLMVIGLDKNGNVNEFYFAVVQFRKKPSKLKWTVYD